MVEFLCVLNSRGIEKSMDGFKLLSGENYYVGIKGNCKFKDDCIFEENSQLLVLLIGVVFNKKQLIHESKKESWFQTITELYIESGDAFFSCLEGSFNGVIFDKFKNRWIFFSNIQSERPVFYSKLGEEQLIASNINLIHKRYRFDNRKLTLDVDGAYMLLSHGFMLNGYTLYNEVRRMRADYYCIFEEAALHEKKYYSFSNLTYTSESEDDIINHLDLLFKKAVKQQFEKDLEYGFKHITSLSGGLDSRMTVCVAHELGYTNQLNITFSQSDYLEGSIASQIAARLKHDWIFKALDNGLFLYDLDKITEFTGGNVLYCGVAHAFSMYSLLSFENFGLLHTGQLGGLFTDYLKHKRPSSSDGATSNRLTNRISEHAVSLDDYENEELFLITNRYFNGTNYGLTGILNFTETFSPFYNMDFWEYWLKIPLPYRYNRNIYKKWIVKKHPLAAEFVYEKTGVKIDNNLRDKFRLYQQGKAIAIEDIFKGLYRKVARELKLKYTPNLQSMNPFEAWLIINHDLIGFFNNYFNEHISLLNNYPELKSDCSDLFFTGNALERIQVLSLLSAVKIFC